MNKKYIYYEIECAEPMIISDNSQLSNLITVRDYIPGNTILGLLAGRFIQFGFSPYDSSGKKYNEDFKTLFLSDDVLYINAYPLHNETQSPCLPMPLSVFGCKYFGENTFDSKKEEHGFKDMTFQTIPLDFACPQCGSKDMKHKEGYLYHHEGELKNLKINKRIDTKINVDGELLYSLEAVEKGNQFYGFIAITSDKFEKYFDLLNDLLFGKGYDNLNFRIGTVRNRGYGLISFKNFEERPFLFNNNIPPEKKQLSIYCYEDLILKNPLNQYYTYLSPEFILEQSGDESLTLRMDLSYWENTTLAGFNNKKKMPLNRELIVKKGSVFVYDVKGDFETENNKLPCYIGSFINRGFGRVIYNHTFLKD
jgi:hypothetical protein